MKIIKKYNKFKLIINILKQINYTIKNKKKNLYEESNKLKKIIFKTIKDTLKKNANK